MHCSIEVQPAKPQQFSAFCSVSICTGGAAASCPSRGVHSLFSAALELFIEMLAPFWLESWKLFFFCLASLGFCTLGAKRTEYSGYCLRLGT